MRYENFYCNAVLIVLNTLMSFGKRQLLIWNSWQICPKYSSSRMTEVDQKGPTQLNIKDNDKGGLPDIRKLPKSRENPRFACHDLGSSA